MRNSAAVRGLCSACARSAASTASSCSAPLSNSHCRLAAISSNGAPGTSPGRSPAWLAGRGAGSSVTGAVRVTGAPSVTGRLDDRRLHRRHNRRRGAGRLDSRRLDHRRRHHRRRRLGCNLLRLGHGRVRPDLGGNLGDGRLPGVGERGIGRHRHDHAARAGRRDGRRQRPRHRDQVDRPAEHRHVHPDRPAGPAAELLPGPAQPPHAVHSGHRGAGGQVHLVHRAAGQRRAGRDRGARRRLLGVPAGQLGVPGAGRVEPGPQRRQPERVVLQHQVERDRLALLGPRPGDLPHHLDQSAQLGRRRGREQQRGPAHHQHVPGAGQPGHVGEQRGQPGPVLHRVAGQLQRRPDLVQQPVRRPCTVAAQVPDHDPVLAEQPAELAGVGRRGVEQVDPGTGGPGQPGQLRFRAGRGRDDSHRDILTLGGLRPPSAPRQGNSPSGAPPSARSRATHPRGAPPPECPRQGDSPSGAPRVPAQGQLTLGGLPRAPRQGDSPSGLAECSLRQLTSGGSAGWPLKGKAPAGTPASAVRAATSAPPPASCSSRPAPPPCTTRPASGS